MIRSIKQLPFSASECAVTKCLVTGILFASISSEDIYRERGSIACNRIVDSAAHMRTMLQVALVREIYTKNEEFKIFSVKYALRVIPVGLKSLIEELEEDPTMIKYYSSDDCFTRLLSNL